MVLQLSLDFDAEKTDVRNIVQKPILNNAFAYGIIHDPKKKESTIDCLVEDGAKNDFGIEQKFAAAMFLYKGTLEIEKEIELPFEFYQSLNTSEIVGFFVGSYAIRNHPDSVFASDEKLEGFLRTKTIEEVICKVVEAGNGFLPVRKMNGSGFFGHEAGYESLNQRVAGLEYGAKEVVKSAIRKYLNPDIIRGQREHNLSGNSQIARDIPKSYAEGYLLQASSIMAESQKTAVRKNLARQRREMERDLMLAGDSSMYGDNARPSVLEGITPNPNGEIFVSYQGPNRRFGARYSRR